MESDFQPSSPLPNNPSSTTRSAYPPSPLSKEYLQGLLAALNAGDNLANLQATHLWADIISCVERFPTGSVRFHVRAYSRAFTGSECVVGLFTFLQAKSDSYPSLSQPGREQVVSLCQQLLEMGHLRPAAKPSKSVFQPDNHPYRFSRSPYLRNPVDSPTLSECSSEVSDASERGRRPNRYHPYLKMAKNSVKKMVKHSREKKVPEEQEHEWVDTVMSRILTYVDMPYLDKVTASRELSDDVIKQNLAAITGEEDGYIPQWITRIFDWLASYQKGDDLPELHTEHMKVSPNEENLPSAILTRLSRHLDTSVGPLIHHSLFDLFEAIAMQFTGESVPKKAIICLQLFLLLPAPHKRSHLSFLITNLARISRNNNLPCSNSEERLLQFLKLFMPCILRPKEKLTRRQSEVYVNINPILCYMGSHPDIVFDTPKDIKTMYQEESKDFSFQDFLAQKQTNLSPLSKCVKASAELTETRGELKKLLDNIVCDESITKEKREDLLHQFSVVYPEIYSQNMSPLAFV